MRTPRVSTVVGATFVIWGTVVGLERLHDNSFLTHVATGRLILAHGVPTTDPYTFTALGRPWVVESWLASVAYRGLENLAGGHGLEVMHAVLCAVLGALGWMLTRPARQLGGRILASCALLAVGTGYWSSRPLLMALVLFAVLVVMVETDKGPPWVLVPVMWVWLNVHGSWPLGLAYLVLRMVGRRLDGAEQGRLPRLLGFGAVGAVAGVANPIGLRLVGLSVDRDHPSPGLRPHRRVADAELLRPRERGVPRRGAAGRRLARGPAGHGRGRPRRGPLRRRGPAGVAQRPGGGAALTPVLARGLAGMGTIDGARRGLVPAVGLVALIGLGVALTAGAMGRPAYDLSLYPVPEVSWLEQHHLVPGRVATTDYVGNYLEFRYGTRASAFIDDRADVFPPAVEKDYGTSCLSGSEGWRTVLARYRFDVVLWPRSEALASLISEDPGWKVRISDRHWVVAVRTPGTRPHATRIRA